jgi:hypothetical protein
MIHTPVSSVVKAVQKIISDNSHAGQIVEVSGDVPGFYFRQQIDYPDEMTTKNFNAWWQLA